MTENLTIEENTRIGDLVNANIEVSNLSTLIIGGIVNGQIIIRASATVVVNGMINGNIINQGLCKIFGTVNGRLIEDNGRFEIDKNALINP